MSFNIPSMQSVICSAYILHIGVEEFNIINWLPTRKRFEQCVCVNIFNFFAGTAPAYVCEMYHPVEQSRYTRRSFKKLCLPNQKTNRGMKTLLHRTKIME